MDPIDQLMLSQGQAIKLCLSKDTNDFRVCLSSIPTADLLVPLLKLGDSGLDVSRKNDRDYEVSLSGSGLDFDSVVAALKQVYESLGQTIVLADPMGRPFQATTVQPTTPQSSTPIDWNSEHAFHQASYHAVGEVSSPDCGANNVKAGPYDNESSARAFCLALRKAFPGSRLRVDKCVVSSSFDFGVE